MGQDRSGAGIFRVYPYVWPTIHSRLSRNAKTVRGLPTRVPNIECTVVGRSIDSGRRLSHTSHLFDLVSPIWTDRWPQSVGSQGTRVDDCFAAPRSEERRVGKECRSRWSP